MQEERETVQKNKDETPKKEPIGVRFRAFFARIFDRLDFKDEEKFFTLVRWIVFVLLVIMEVLVFMQFANKSNFDTNYGKIVGVLCIEIVLTVTEGVKLFVFDKFHYKIPLYVIDFLAVFLLIVMTLSTYLCPLYIILMTELYISLPKKTPSWLVFLVSVPLYIFAYAAVLIFQSGTAHLGNQVFTQSFSALIALTIHYIALRVVVSFYRQYLNLIFTKAELEDSNAALKKAYDGLAAMAALEERQRIAKDIHDTAGHAITTVIMQTEAAKLIIDSDVTDAKLKIIAANIQAKHALKELRDSVHLLSGSSAKEPLKNALERIINETTDGTGVVIRYDIENIDVASTQYRFICNSLKEGIANGLRHGGATAFYFELKSVGQGIEFLLSDNGKGIDLATLKEGLGLSGLCERAERFGGSVDFVSEQDEGFEIHMVLPLGEKDGDSNVDGE